MAFLQLLSLCSFMFACSMAVGCLPLVVSFSHRHLRTLTTFGVGLLIGTAFIVIIPEGIHTLYTPPASASAMSPHAHTTADSTAAGLLDAAYWQRWWRVGPLSNSGEADADMHEKLHAVDAGSHGAQHNMRAQQLLHDVEADSPAIVRIVAAAPTDGEGGGTANNAAHSHVEQPTTEHPAGGRSLQQLHEAAEGAAAGDLHSAAGQSVGEHDENLSECVFEPEGSGYIGASLALGFVVMLLVDRVSGGHSHGPPAPHPDSRTTRGELPHRPLPASGKRVAGVSRRAVSDIGGSLSSERGDRTDEDDSVDDVMQRTSVIYIAAPNTRPVATAAALGSTGSAQQSLDAGRERELTAEEREKERERQRVEREKEREKAHGYAPYASGSLPSATDPSTALSSSVASSNATIGILVHSFVDGIALGAISLSSDSSLEMVVFFAILLHKGPAALGLVSFLMYQGRSQLYIRTQLTMFSLCAPIAALLTYALLAAPLPSAASGLPSPSSPSALGLMLLFSGGTFLFTIAVHIMPTIRQTRTARPSQQPHSHSHSHSHAHSHSHLHGQGYPRGTAGSEQAAAYEGTADPSHSDEERDSELGSLLAKQQRSSREQPGDDDDTEPLEWRYVLVLIAGILAPLLFSVGHSHAHG